jgi:hypothetical protein
MLATRKSADVSGKILQLVTAARDWTIDGRDLLAHDPMDIKGIVYEMRFDEVTVHAITANRRFYVGCSCR